MLSLDELPMALNERFETNLQLNGLIMHLEGDDGGHLLGPSIVECHSTALASKAFLAADSKIAHLGCNLDCLFFRTSLRCTRAALHKTRAATP